MKWLLAIAILIGIAEAASYLICKTNKDIKDLLLETFKRTRRGDARTFTPRYAEHAFLAFSLNPEFRNSSGKKIHNKYGFREYDDFKDLENKSVIYCMGASSTYCNFIDENEDTWPAILEQKFRNASSFSDVKVINGGCGAWTSFQSLIRLSAWIDIIKPKLIIVYDGKNDFSPFLNAKLSVKEIFPDYGNIVRSFRLSYVARMLDLMSLFSCAAKVFYARYINEKYKNILSHIYVSDKNLTRLDAIEGLKRVGNREFDFIFSRFKSVASLAKERGIPVLFVTQKLVKHLLEPQMKILNDRIKTLGEPNRGCFVYDFAGEKINEDTVLSDHIHFTKEGARQFSEYLMKYIMRNIAAWKENTQETIKS